MINMTQLNIAKIEQVKLQAFDSNAVAALAQLKKDGLPLHISMVANLFICNDNIKCQAQHRDEKTLKKYLRQETEGFYSFLFIPLPIGEDNELYVQGYRFQEIKEYETLNFIFDNPDFKQKFIQNCIYGYGCGSKKRNLIAYRKTQKSPNKNYVEILYANNGTINVIDNIVQTQNIEKLPEKDDRLWVAAICPNISFTQSRQATELKMTTNMETTGSSYKAAVANLQRYVDEENENQKKIFGAIKYSNCEKIEDNEIDEDLHQIHYKFTLENPWQPDDEYDFSQDISLAAESLNQNDSQDETAKSVRPIPVGIVVKIAGNSLITKMEGPSPEDQPTKKGQLVLNLSGEEQIARRRNDALAFLTSPSERINPIPSILFNETSQGHVIDNMPIREEKKEYISNGQSLNDEQKKAVWTALNTPDIAIIQGPPGTGKTTVIQAICERFTELYNHSSKYEEQRQDHFLPRVLITSFQHVAVDNALDGITVGGVPVYKVPTGKEVEDQDFGDSLRKWAEGIAQTSQQNQKKEIVSADLERFKQYKEKYREYHNQPSPDTLKAVVVILKEICQNPSVSEEFKKDVETLNTFANPAEQRQEIVRILKSQRLFSAAFNDDGQKNARKLYEYIHKNKKDSKIPLKSELIKDIENCLKEVVFNYYNHPEEIPEDTQKKYREYVKMLYPLFVDSNQEVTNNLLYKWFVRFNEVIDSPDAKAAIIATQFTDELQNTYKEIVKKYTVWRGATCQGSANLIDKKNRREMDLIIVDEAARAHPADLLIPLSQGNKVILVGDHKQLPPMLEAKAAERMKLSQKDSHDLLKKSWFEILFDQLPTKRVSLVYQYRMPKEVFEFVNKEFYGTLKHGKLKETPIDSSLCQGKQLCCVDVSSGNEIRVGRSFWRESEVEFIGQYVRKIVRLSDEHGKKYSIGVITFYSEQNRRLKQKIYDMVGENRERLQIGTVDSFQGKEFDFVILSCVRSNSHGEVGFLKSVQRQCVAFSRAKVQLVVCGDFRTLQSDPHLKNLYETCHGGITNA